METSILISFQRVDRVANPGLWSCWPKQQLTCDLSRRYLLPSKKINEEVSAKYPQKRCKRPDIVAEIKFNHVLSLCDLGCIPKKDRNAQTSLDTLL